MKNIIETVISHQDLKIFLQAVMETDLYDILAGDGPYTIFAPTDTAFRKLPLNTIEKLFQDKEQLTEILTRHIVLFKIKSTDLEINKKIQTANGKKISLKNHDKYIIESATIIKKDIICENGIIHTINEVLL